MWINYYLIINLSPCQVILKINKYSVTEGERGEADTEAKYNEASSKIKFPLIGTKIIKSAKLSTDLYSIFPECEKAFYSIVPCTI
jgi:hypothetical protein